MGVKRSIDQHGAVEGLEMAECLILLSHNKYDRDASKGHVFECRTCNKKFSSFQALGGHRASHKRPKSLVVGEKLINDDESSKLSLASSLVTKKPKKMHECSICGLEFSLGQALGGHMRRHRAAMVDGFVGSDVQPNAVVPKLPVLRRSSSSKRVFGLDLNLTPLENDLAYLFGKIAPRVETFLSA